MKKYFAKDIEPKWQEYWQKEGIYKFKKDSKKQKYYNLVELPYPSGDLHLGHWFAFTPPDAHARYKRMRGFNVFYPNGFDSFGLPAENAAIKRGVHPKDWTYKNIEVMKKQFETMGTMIDWESEVITSDPEYYRWNQWIFIKMFEKGLAYRGKALSNWCPKDLTVLANEHIEQGKCWRCGTEVVQKEVEQWFLKITDYADKLIWPENPKVDWPKEVREGQNNWIGKKEGMLIKFPVVGSWNYVLLHGFTGSSKGDFFPWVKKELEKDDLKVQIPDLPNTDDAKVEEQADFVLKNLKFDENTVLFGHSLGTPVALKVVEKLKNPIKKLVLAAAFAQPGFLDHERVFEKTFNWKFDFENIKKNVGEVVILRAENDSAVPRERAEFIKEKLEARIVDFKATSDHVTGKEEPVILENLLPSIEVFTTRPETTDGASFLVIAPEHPLAKQVKNKEAQAYIEKASKKTEMERKEDRTKSGIFSGFEAKNSVTGKNIPIWISDYVLSGYGTGAIMAVPYADERDKEFAEKLKLPIIETKFNAKPQGKKTTTYHLRDWSVSRQRYWGTPVPMIHCENCGIVPVPLDDLPVELPYEVDFTPKGKPPLASDEKWLNVKCPNCEGPAKRDAETLDTFFDSAWYYYRYLSPDYKEGPFDKLKIKEFMPIDIYFGGSEHTLGHTLYARFFTKFFKDLAMVDFDEFAQKRAAHGVILGPDGARMSKSRGNVVNPDDFVKEYGADTVRLYICFMMPYTATAPWSDSAISGVYKFLKRVWELQSSLKEGELDTEELFQMHSAIKKVGEDLETLNFNTAVSALMIWLNFLSSKKAIYRLEYETLLKLLAPFAPHITEEIWHSINPSANSIHIENFPLYQAKHISTEFTSIVIQVNGKVRDTIEIKSKDMKNQKKVENEAKNSEKVKKYIENGVKKTIYIPGKVINFVV